MKPKTKNSKSIERNFRKDLKNSEIRNELNEIKKLEERIDRNDLKYEANKYVYNFQQFETIRSWDDSIFSEKISISQAEEDQSSLLKNIVEFNNKSRPRTKQG